MMSARNLGCKTNVIQNKHKYVFENIFNFTLQYIIEEITFYSTNFNLIFKINARAMLASIEVCFWVRGRKEFEREGKT